MESDFHVYLKELAFSELEEEGYDLYIEPPDSPLDRIMWNFYRPDILGLMCDEAMLKLVLVECETNPKIGSMKRKTSKILRSFTIQKKLNEKHLLRLLLLIPHGTLHRVNHSVIRGIWEIWIANNNGEIPHKILPHQNCLSALDPLPFPSQIA